MSRRSRARHARQQHSLHRIDALEARRLLSAAYSVQTLEWHDQSVEVAAGRWIVQLGQLHGSVGRQSSTLQQMLAQAAPGFSLDRQLGQDGLFRVTAPVSEAADAVVQELSSMPGFSFAEPDLIVHADAMPNDTSFNSLWGMNNTGQFSGVSGTDIRAVQAWDIATGSSSNVVGVIDTGVDYNHPDLAANIWTNPGEIVGNGMDDDGNGYVDDIHGWDFANNDNDPMDDNNHGTHVSGTIGAVGNNSRGVAGVNWNVQIMALKFLAANGMGATSDAVSCVNYATLMRTRGVNIGVTNNSWGGGGFDPALYSAIQAAGNAGMLFVAAAGNNGGNLDAGVTSYPASYDLPNIISVANITSADQLNGTSNYGATSVDLGAPGTNILSTVRNNGYSFFTGTSMASPHVAGVAGLLFSMSPTAGWQAVRDAIFNGVDADSALSGKTVTGGRLNAFKAAQAFSVHPDLLASSDSGSSSTDNITNDNTPTFVGPSAPNASVTIFANGTQVGGGVANVSGQYNITSSPLADGAYDITATWPGQSGPTIPINIRIDTVSLVPGMPVLLTTDDTGVSNSDNFTRLTTLHFSGPAEAGTARLYVDGVLAATSSVASGAPYNLTATGLTAGLHNFTTTLADIAGNPVSSASPALAVTIKTSAAAPSTPDLDPSRDSAINTDNITKFMILKFNGTSEDGVVTLLIDGLAKGGGAASGGTYTINPPSVNEGTHTIAVYVVDPAGNISPNSGSIVVKIDITRLSVTSFDFAFDAPTQQLNLTFSEDVRSALQRQDLHLFNSETGASIAAADMALVYDAPTNAAAFSFPGLSGAVLPDANYEAILSDTVVSDLAGNALIVSVNDFFVLSADANRDRNVDTVDFNTLAAHFGQSGTFSTGDFNYDGAIDTTDFNLLAANFNKTLPEPPPPADIVTPAAVRPDAALSDGILDTEIPIL